MPFSQFLCKQVQDIMQLPLQAHKKWFKTVKNARMNYEQDKAKKDVSSNKLGFCQQWVGLKHSLLIKSQNKEHSPHKL